MALLKQLKILQKRKLKKLKKDNTLFSIIKTKAKEFCLATNLHGYNYIGQSQRSPSERFVWVIIVFSMLCCSIILMKVAWDYNTSRSTLTIIESVHHGIWNFPFPAVTICNINQVSREKAHEFVDNLKVLNGLKREYIFKEMKLLLEMIDPGVFGYDVQFNLSQLQDVFKANNYTAPQVMQLVKQDCTRLIKNCKWKGQSYICDNIFEEVYARDGICCSFNYFHAKSRINKKKKPLVLNSCGYQTGLTFQVHPEPQNYFATLYGSYGVKAIIHYPYDYPSRSDEFRLISLGVQNFLSISPEQTYVTKAFRKQSANSRVCVFKEDKLTKNLSAAMNIFGMSEYSFPNCMNLHCRGSIVADECNCIPYYLPQNVTRTCDLNDLRCLTKIRHIYDTSWPGIDIDSMDIPFINFDLTKRSCGCKVDCANHRYPVDSTQGPLNKNFIAYNNNSKSRNRFNTDDILIQEFGTFSLINVFYTDLVALQYRKNVYITWKYLFAAFGGLLGLFIGFSVTNGFELIYFFVIRVIIDSYNKKRNRILFNKFIKN